MICPTIVKEKTKSKAAASWKQPQPPTYRIAVSVSRAVESGVS